MLVYSQFIFVVLRALTLVLESSIEQTALAASRSIIYSCDVAATLSIYFVPKFFRNEGQDCNENPFISTHHQTSSHVHRQSIIKKGSAEKKSVHIWKSSNRLESIDESENEEDDENFDTSCTASSSLIRPVSFAEDTNFRTHAEWENSDEEGESLPVVAEGDAEGGTEGGDDEHMEIVFVDADDKSDHVVDT
mmetsp:Transcript_17507/g.40772  ORF Transcript_17507/g.40772 Transcript_17507/m.40772 type:complete len:192 (-) Transcript_17507:1639-2214(-)